MLIPKAERYGIKVSIEVTGTKELEIGGNEYGTYVVGQNVDRSNQLRGQLQLKLLVRPFTRQCR